MWKQLTSFSSYLLNFESRVFYTAVTALESCQLADKWKGSEKSHFQIQHVAYLWPIPAPCFRRNILFDLQILPKTQMMALIDLNSQDFTGENSPKALANGMWMDKGSVCPCYIDGSVGALVHYSHTYFLFFCNTSSLLSLALACDAPSHSIGNHSKTAVQLTSVSMTETNEHFMALLSLYDCIWRWLSTTAANIVTRESLKMVGRTNAECPGSAQPKKRHVNACLLALSFLYGWRHSQVLTWPHAAVLVSIQ